MDIKKITFLAYCKANPMWFVGIFFFVFLTIAALAEGSDAGKYVALFMCFCGLVLIIGQIVSYRKL